MASESFSVTARPPFAMVPHGLLDAGLGHKALLVYLGLSRFANTRREVWPSVPKVGALVGLSVSSVIRGLATLEETGWVSRKRDQGKVNHYLLLWGAPVSEGHGTRVPGTLPTRVPVTHEVDVLPEVDSRTRKNLTALSGATPPDPLPTKGVLKDPADQQRAALELLGFLNRRTGHHYKPVPATLKLIVARLREGATITQVRSVIGSKTDQWRDDPKMAEFLRPATLFNATNFANYSGQLPEGALQVEP